MVVVGIALGSLVKPVECFSLISGDRYFVDKNAKKQHGSLVAVRSGRRIDGDGGNDSVALGDSSNADDNREEGGDDLDLSLEAFQRAKEKRRIQQVRDDEAFDGYALRDVIYEKWGACYDIDFNRVDALGFRSVYLNVLPYRLGRRPFRHDSELDYLCHLQAVVEILQKYEQLDYVLYQIAETSKRPIAGRSPIVAVPLRLDLSREQVASILRY